MGQWTSLADNYLRKVDFPPKPLAVRMRERAGYRHTAPPMVTMSGEHPIAPRRHTVVEPEPRAPKGYANREPLPFNVYKAQPMASGTLLASLKPAMRVLGWVYNYKSVHEMSITVGYSPALGEQMRGMYGPPYFSV